MRYEETLARSREVMGATSCIEHALCCLAPRGPHGRPHMWANPAIGPGDTSTALDAGGTALVISEISAAGEEWVELFNAGASPVDLSDVQVADSDPDGGARASRAMRFPRGTTRPPGRYVLVLANQSDAGAGP